MASTANTGTLDFLQKTSRDRDASDDKSLRAVPLNAFPFRPDARSGCGCDVMLTILDGLYVRNDFARNFVAQTRSHLPPAFAFVVDEIEYLSARLSENLERLDQAKWEQTAMLHVGPGIEA
jgi:hypothetical protein